MKNWITIQDYAVKYGVSVSTLRRRIKSDKISYRFDDGKYFIEDQAENPNSAVNQPLEEIKALYERLLKEKDDQILRLREQIADLETLTQILESELEKYKSKTTPNKIPALETKESLEIKKPDTSTGIDFLPDDPLRQFYKK